MINLNYLNMRLKTIMKLSSQMMTTLSICLNDFLFLMKNSYNYHVNTRDKMMATIMLGMHSIEKGMSFTIKKKNWGREKAYNLCKHIEKAINLYGEDARLQIAMSVLNSYTKDSHSCKDQELLKSITALLNKHYKLNVNAGVKEIVRPYFTASTDEILDFYRTRTSVRYFSKCPINDEELAKVEMLLSYTPTACNRQACKTYAFRGDICKEIIANQLGDQGWCMNADMVFVVTANGSYFNSTFESKEAYIDGGMYAMNLCMGLHMLKIGSCFKMFVRTPKIEKEFKKICKLQENEIPIVLLLAGHYDEDHKNMQPVSVRLQSIIEKRN